LTDHLGTVHAIVDQGGAVVESYRYDAWGRVDGVFDAGGVELPESALGNRYLWQGREYSWKTGLYYFRARWYDPITGRWLSNDPIGISGGLNQYVFCGNDPVNMVDPFGNAAKEITRYYRADGHGPHTWLGWDRTDDPRDFGSAGYNNPFQKAGTCLLIYMAKALLTKLGRSL
jgi:RHS repeat-associated protein